MQTDDTPIGGSLERLSPLLAGRQGKGSRLRGHLRARAIRWFILEEEVQDNDTILYGIVVGLAEDEYGYVSLNELSDVTLDLTAQGLGKLQVRRQENFRPTKLKDLQDYRLQQFLAGFEH